jgi:nucleoside phosphorylase
MDRVQLARRIIDFGLTEQDLSLGRHPTTAAADREALLHAAPAPLGVAAAVDALEPHFPSGLRPVPQALDPVPEPGDTLPRTDYVVITWTVAEQQALVDVLTPGLSRSDWHPYDRNFETDFLPEIRHDAPARAARRLASYSRTSIGDKTVLCVKSELHMNQDGVRTGDGTATLPVARLFRQLIAEVQPRLVITTGTAGATYADHDLGDAIITRAAKFRCTQEFAHEPFASSEYRCDVEVPQKYFDAAKELLGVHAQELTEPDFGPPTTRYQMPGDRPLLPGRRNHPALRVDGRDFEAFRPMLTTDFFEFGTSENRLAHEGCGVEMGDAVLGLVCDELGADAPRWLVVRNASDPQINGLLPEDVQAMWAVWFYEQYGYWTSLSSAIACWAVIAGDESP